MTLRSPAGAAAFQSQGASSALKSPLHWARYSPWPAPSSLLGRFEVLRAAAPIELPPSGKARALLAYLVATGRAHDRGHLAGLLWDERDDARAVLRWALTRLIEEATRSAAEISQRKPGSSGFHDWLWALRLAWARAEVSAARGDGEEAERWAAETLARARGTRPKDEAAALVTARPFSRRGRHPEALADLDRALAIARGSGDPALLLRAAIPSQALEGSDQLAQEFRAVEQQIAAGR
jgi:hypothetical protein